MSLKNCHGRKKLIYTLLLAATVYSSCSYKQNQVLFEKNLSDTASRHINYVTAYKIQVQDLLQIRNMQNISYIISDLPAANNAAPSSTTSQGQNYLVEEDGTIGLPVLGRVKVAGLTRMEATRKIEDLYRKNLVKDPVIELKIVNLKVTVFGEVKTPGNYPLIKDRTTLTEVLGQAGGLTEKGDEKKIQIIRGGTINPQVTDIDLSKFSSLTNPAIILQNQDIIYVAQNKRAIRNDKYQNFSTVIQPALILMNTALLIFTLVKK